MSKDLRPDTGDGRSLPCVRCGVTTPDASYEDGLPICDNCAEPSVQVVSGMDELVSFVRAALDEDERVARAADPKRHRAIVTDALARKEIGTHHNARLIAEWDPARVLAEVEAKRRILDEYESYAPDEADDYEQAQFSADATSALKPVVHLLAQRYAGLPGWREEWRA